MANVQIDFEPTEVEIIKEALMNYAIYMLRMHEDENNCWDNINYPLKAKTALQIIRRLNDAKGLNYNESGNPSKSSSTSPEGK